MKKYSYNFQYLLYILLKTSELESKNNTTKNNQSRHCCLTVTKWAYVLLTFKVFSTYLAT